MNSLNKVEGSLNHLYKNMSDNSKTVKHLFLLLNILSVYILASNVHTQGQNYKTPWQIYQDIKSKYHHGVLPLVRCEAMSCFISCTCAGGDS